MLLNQRTDSERLTQDAQVFFPQAQRFRRALHELAELSWQETLTCAYLLKELERIQASSLHPFKITNFVGGIAVDLDVKSAKKRLLLRADIDGLPIQEKTGLPFSSKQPHTMHACGHDFHAAMLLSALEIISLNPIPPLHHLRLVFQRAEEIGTGNSGGKVLVDENILADVDEAIALHISGLKEKGTFFSRPGALLANTSCIDIKLSASGGHVMHPHQGSNCIDIITDLLVSLRGIASTIIPPQEPVALVVSQVHAGIANNIRPFEGEIRIALRNFLAEQSYQQLINGIRTKVEAIVQGFPSAFLTCFRVEKGYPALLNDPQSVAAVGQLLSHVFPVKEIEPSFAGEDFSYFLQKTKGCYWILGAKNGEGHDHHTADFNPCESILSDGINFWLHLCYLYEGGF